MTAQARFTQADIRRALRAAKQSGFGEVKVRIDARGQIEIIVGQAANDSLPPEELE